MGGDSLGPWVGWNLREKDPGNPDKKSTLVGPELRVGYNITPEWTVFGDIAGFSTLNTSASDGYGGRGVIGVGHQWNLGKVHPFIGPHVGYIAGKGVQDGVVAGPEIGLNYDVAEKVFLYGRAGYDHDFRNDFGQGIINGGLGAGLRF
ncbi:MAG: hypothetical protein IPK78_15020 [Rhodospirillales bacterium]|nr:hypothetical protein [Rhodospirillales bacterium]